MQVMSRLKQLFFSMSSLHIFTFQSLLPLNPEHLFLSLVTSLEIYCPSLIHYISLSCNSSFELLLIEFLPCICTLHVLNRFCLFFFYLSVFCLSNYGPSQKTTAGQRFVSFLLQDKINEHITEKTHEQPICMAQYH